MTKSGSHSAFWTRFSRINPKQMLAFLFQTADIFFSLFRSNSHYSHALQRFMTFDSEEKAEKKHHQPKAGEAAIFAKELDYTVCFYDEAETLWYSREGIAWLFYDWIDCDRLRTRAFIIFIWTCAYDETLMGLWQKYHGRIKIVDETRWVFLANIRSFVFLSTSITQMEQMKKKRWQMNARCGNKTISMMSMRQFLSLSLSLCVYIEFTSRQLGNSK